jgi:hypothetical protein
LLKDHSKTDASRDYNYPQRPVYIYEFAVTPARLLAIEEFINHKVAHYGIARKMKDDAIPECQPKERWDRPPKFAVKKETRKTAIRLLDNEDDAAQMAADLGKGHYVEHRPGESIRCQSYCLCREFCNYYTGNVKPRAERPKLQDDSFLLKMAA